MRKNMNSWDELIKAFDLGLIDGEKEVEYQHRLYYDVSGNIIKTTAFKSDPIYDQPFIIIDQVPNNLFEYKIKNNKLVKNTISNQQIHGLVKAQSGFKVVLNNPALLLFHDEVFNKTEYYDLRNN